MSTEAEHLRHMTDGRWHDDCWHCRRRREQGETGITGPPDLAHAIQAATEALDATPQNTATTGWRWWPPSSVARVAVTAAWSVLVDAHDHQAHLLTVEVADLQRRLDHAVRNTVAARDFAEFLRQGIAAALSCHTETARIVTLKELLLDRPMAPGKVEGDLQ